jgi:hypothetical protein
VAWDGMTSSAQEDYLMGAFDESMLRKTTETATDSAYIEGASACTLQLKLDSAALRKIVNEGYQREAELYGYPPAVVLRNQLVRICRLEINSERAKRGLKPFRD